jgi:hypothetical protein
MRACWRSFHRARGRRAPPENGRWAWCGSVAILDSEGFRVLLLYVSRLHGPCLSILTGAAVRDGLKHFHYSCDSETCTDDGLEAELACSSPQRGNGRRKCQRLAMQTLAKSSWPLTNTQRGRRAGLGRQPGIQEGGKAVMGERAHTLPAWLSRMHLGSRHGGDWSRPAAERHGTLVLRAILQTVQTVQTVQTMPPVQQRARESCLAT